eukprot:5749711-Pleurochrysis_carterae.AAC.1
MRIGNEPCVSADDMMIPRRQGPSTRARYNIRTILFYCMPIAASAGYDHQIVRQSVYSNNSAKMISIVEMFHIP